MISKDLAHKKYHTGKLLVTMLQKGWSVEAYLAAKKELIAQQSK